MEKLPEVWSTRDYPVLREACRLIEAGEPATRQALVEATGLSETELTRSFSALDRQDYLTSVDQRGGTVMEITGVSGQAYRVVGLHPDPRQDLATLLVERLLAAADQAPDEADKGRLRKAAGLIGDVTKSVTAGVVSGLITSGITG